MECAMNRHLMTLRVTVKDGERALLTRNGRFERVRRRRRRGRCSTPPS